MKLERAKIWTLKKWLRRRYHSHPAMYLAIVSILYAALITACVQLVSVAAYSYRHPVRYAPTFETEQQAREYHRLLRKHGLDTQVAVVYSQRGKWFFIRNGQECELK